MPQTHPALESRALLAFWLVPIVILSRALLLMAISGTRRDHPFRQRLMEIRMSRTAPTLRRA
jgi:hypothetical protein